MNIFILVPYPIVIGRVIIPSVVIEDLENLNNGVVIGLSRWVNLIAFHVLDDRRLAELLVLIKTLYKFVFSIGKVITIASV